MADNDTGKIMWEALQLNKDADWFYDRIRRTRNGRKLDALRLGNQVVFPSEQWEEHLRLIGYHVYTGERWIYHDNKAQSTVESI
ncbi:hypothetical protein PACILC2_15030 [Paenibacillus cisolokensis]|uniref:Uncharacterized protein n=2 Tax=Paenibacillus TaxID=44249 RepID=A0ABQ4N459_9BACL|nr:hypothetical protein [Paenibacillus cisolokensis]GIQ62935.1 hypothetical protein PACILC2_15030 [Paenibacillus cisolokensis]